MHPFGWTVINVYVPCVIFEAMKTGVLAFIVVALLLSACGTNKTSFSPAKKYAVDELQKDYSVYQQTLEEAHPGLYWYTSKDSMDRYFEWGRDQLKNSLTEAEFRKVLSYVTSKINCGHTSVRSSKRYSDYLDTVRLGRLFPLSLKLWDDTAVVASNLNRRDTILTRGVMVNKINGHTIKEIVDTCFEFIPTDGYNRTHKFQSLSNRGYFGALYTSIYGSNDSYSIEYTDSTGKVRRTTAKAYYPAADTFARSVIRASRPLPQPSRKERKERQRNSIRLLKIDSTTHLAMMDLNSFGRGYGLQRFFKRSFKSIRKNDISHLIIDVRGNGGGSVTNSTEITRYLSKERFKVADSLYAITKKKTYSRYIKNDFFNRLFITFFAGKKKDGYYHFRYFEKHYFKPKKKNHYDGQVYILTGGNSFSATTLFASCLVKQDNVTVVGEETGGGAYGNSAWLIPDVTLPNTKVRFRLPLFRLVIDKETPWRGRGVQPEVESKPSIEAIKRGADYKLEKTMELIEKDKKSRRPPGLIQ